MIWILGTAQFVRDYGFSGVNVFSGESEFGQIINLVSSAGFECIDTAPAYGDAEPAIGRSRTTLRIHTKFDPNLSPDDSVARSLRALNRSTLEVVYIHDSKELGKASARRLQQYWEASKQASASLGVSIYDVDEFDTALNTDFVEYIQVPANVLDRRFSSDRARSARASGKKIVARSAFLQGALLANPLNLPARVAHLREGVTAFQKICSRHGLSPLAGALEWIASCNTFDGLILGIGSAFEALEIIDAFPSGKVSVDFLGDLESLALPAWSDIDPRRW